MERGNNQNAPLSSQNELKRAWETECAPLVRHNSRLRSRLILNLILVFAFFWLVHRANKQSVTLDEANTFLNWVVPDAPSHWTAHSNNHVLNSALMKLSVFCFGVSPLTLRLPTLFGALVYLFSAAAISNRISKNRLRKCLIFVCLAFNPFIMDYLVVARGYGMATGFLLAAQAILISIYLQPISLFQSRMRLALVSVFCGLSFSASFVFLFASMFVLVATTLALFLRFQFKRQLMLKLLVAAIVPYASIVFFICGGTLVDFPRDQLFWGTDAVAKMAYEMYSAAFALLNLNIANPLAVTMLNWFRDHAPLLFLITALLGVYIMTRGISSEIGTLRSSRAGLCLLFYSLVGLTLLAHYLHHKLFHVPLPFERTSIQFVPMTTVAIALFFSYKQDSRAGKIFAFLGTVLLSLTSIYFVCCLRDNYFREWSINADAQDAYLVLKSESKRIGAKEIISHPDYAPSLKFYQIYLRDAEVGWIDSPSEMPGGRLIYVLPIDRYREFAAKEKLRLIFRGKLSDLSVLVNDMSPNVRK